MKYFIFIFIAVGLLTLSLSAQQQQTFSQYHLNDFAFVPATAGTKAYTSFQSAYRKQWEGVEGAPQTLMAYIQLPIEASFGNIGLGVTAFSDKAAAIKRTGASFTYAQHWPINESTSFSLGITGSVAQYSLDIAKIAPSLDAGDPLLNRNNSGKVGLDAGFSAYVYGENWSIGMFADNLTESKMNFYNLSEAKLYRHYYLMAQYAFSLDDNEDFTLMPAVLGITATNAPMQINTNLNLIHQNNKWLGLSYRTNQTHSWSANVGFIIADKIVAGYAYDMVAGKANQFNTQQNSCHEITLGIRFFRNNDPARRQTACPLL